MEVSLYSLLMAVVWSSLYIILLLSIRAVTNLIVRFGVLPLVVLYLGCIFRMLFPYDIHGFTEVIQSETVYAALDTLLNKPILPKVINGFSITPIWILFGIWIIVTLVLLLRDVRDYYKISNIARCQPVITSGPAYDCALMIAQELDIKRFRLIITDIVTIPCVSGFIYPTVFFPVGEHTEQEYRYSFLHEFSHWKNGDVYVRALSMLFFDLFWWNPCSYLLLKSMNKTLELRCDVSVVGKKSIESRTEYVDVLYSMAVKGSNNQHKKKYMRLTSAMSENKFDEKFFKQRVDMAIDYIHNHKRNRLVTIFTVAFLIVSLVFSYRYIIQPYYKAPLKDFETESGYSIVTPQNEYLVLNSDGSYSLYIDDVLIQVLSQEAADNLLNDGFTLINNNLK